MNKYNKIVNLIKQNKTSEAISLIELNHVINEKIDKETGNNLLHVACLYNREEIAKNIFNKKTASQINSNLMTPLYYCVMNNNEDLCNFFIENGVRPDKETLFNAARMSSLSIIKILFIRKTPFNILDHRNQNMLIHAIKQKRGYNIIDYLSNKCDLNQEDIYKNTPMHYASKCLRAGYDKILILLSKKGADIIQRNSSGSSAIDYIKSIELKINIINLTRKYARFYRRRGFLMFLAQYKFLQGNHISNTPCAARVFNMKGLYRQIMSYL